MRQEKRYFDLFWKSPLKSWDNFGIILSWNYFERTGEIWNYSIHFFLFIFLVICYRVASVIGIILLIAAANLSTRQEYLDATGLCYTVKPGVFAGGGGLALVACIFGLWSYSSVTKHHVLSVPVAVPYNQGGIAMGNPQFATASAYTNPKQQQYVWTLNSWFICGVSDHVVYLYIRVLLTFGMDCRFCDFNFVRAMNFKVIFSS